MRKSFRAIILAGLIIVSAAFTAILFLILNKVNPDRMKDPVFWFVFAFTIPVNVIVAVALHLWSGHKDSSDIVQMPVVYYLIAVFGLAYIVSGAIMMFLPFKDWTVPVIVEILISVAYIGVAMYLMTAANYISKTQKHTKQKVLYVRMLQMDVEACISQAPTEKVRAALTDFAEKVHYSDPMSHESLSGVEKALSANVANISAILATGTEEEALELIKTGLALLEQRNKRCIMLK